jgi:hypothetical protein
VPCVSTSFGATVFELLEGYVGADEWLVDSDGAEVGEGGGDLVGEVAEGLESLVPMQISGLLRSACRSQGRTVWVAVGLVRWPRWAGDLGSVGTFCPKRPPRLKTDDLPS